LYSNGFTIEDGPLRSYTDPANEKFMKDLKAGYIPDEIRKTYGKKRGVGVANYL
jgi:UBX domain-containing protein 1